MAQVGGQSVGVVRHELELCARWHATSFAYKARARAMCWMSFLLRYATSLIASAIRADGYSLVCQGRVNRDVMACC